MATDIAFSLGVLTLVKGVAPELKIFLLSLAIADDIGAIAVIAVFYSAELHLEYLLIAALVLAVILLCRKLGIGRQILYALLGFGFWLAVLRSGIHATIAGVILGFLMPVQARVSLDAFSELGKEMIAEFREAQATKDTARANRVLGAMEYLLENTEAPADRVTRKLHDWIAFLVLPLFALSNAGVTFSTATLGAMVHSPVAWGVLIGLFVGKPLGVFGLSWLAVKVRLAQLPSSVSWSQIAGVGVLAGIGFTVSLFISALAFDDGLQLDSAKTAILLASLVAGIAGYLLLTRVSKRQALGIRD
jgi:NhaA family Na+:H+ antiporter